MSFALGVRTSIYNGKMRELRKKTGMSQYEIDDMFDMPKGTISRIETFKDYPTYEKLEDIAVLLGSTIEILFPEWLREQRLKISSYDATVMVEKLTLDSPEVLMLEAPDTLDLYDTELMKEELHKILGALSDREQTILTMRFGLDGMGEHTLQEVGDEFGVTKDRIRQIEAKALSKLRKHEGNNKLKEMYSGK